MSKRGADGRSQYMNVEKRARQDLSYLFHIPPTLRTAAQEECDGLKLPLYPHQKRSLKRMIDLEQNPVLKDLGTFKELTTLGGVVADTVGLGKTAEVIALTVKRAGIATRTPSGDAIPVRANLIICPAHLCNSWLDEVRKFSHLRGLVATNAMPHSEIIDTDIIILPIECLSVGTYVEQYELATHWTANSNGAVMPLWHRYVFRRVVYDEAHDSIFLSNSALNTFRTLQSDNVWCVTGTPFPHADSSIYAINALLGLKLKIALTESPFAMSTNRKIPQSDVFTRLKARIYIRNTPDTVGEELEMALPSPFPIEGGENSSGVANTASSLTAGYTEDVFYIDLCDVERAFYRDESLRTSYTLRDGSDHPDAWHSKFTKLRMYCSTPLVGSLAADAELDGEDVQLAPLVDRDVRNRQDKLFTLSLDQLRVHVVGQRESEMEGLKRRKEALERDIAAARASVEIIKRMKVNRVTGWAAEYEEFEDVRRFRATGELGGILYFESFRKFMEWTTEFLPSVTEMEFFINTTETWITKAMGDLEKIELERVEANRSRDFFKSMTEKVKSLQVVPQTEQAPTADGEAANAGSSEAALVKNEPKDTKPIVVDVDGEGDEDPSATLVDRAGLPSALTGVSDGSEDEPETCLVCSEDLIDIAILGCGHYACPKCVDQWISLKGNCPTCRKETLKTSVAVVTIRETKRHLPRLVARYGTKPAALIRMLQANLANPDDPDPRFIVFSQYDRMLHVLAASLKAEGIESVTCRGNRTRKEAALLKFRTSATCRVLMMSLSNATAAGTNLQNANHVIIVEAASGMNPSHCATVETQAIGRTVRLGQRRQVKVTRFIARNTIEERLYHLMLERGGTGRDLVGGKKAGGKVEVIEILDD